MGVHSFWEIVGPTARPVRLESLEEKKMAIDASIWIYQFLKAIRDDEGNAVKNSHITGFFRRICKLLYFGIKPVFVFDGGVPVLKRKTIQARNEIRQGKRDSAQKTARKLLALQMHQQEGKSKSPSINTPPRDVNSVQVFKPDDDWDLPDIEGFLYEKDDQRINPNYDEEKKKKLSMNATVDDIIDDMDLDSINPASKEFEELPKAVQYQILSKLRLKSRLRMGYTKEQLQNVFPDSLDFSKFQIDMVRRRNFYTQKIITSTGMHDGGASKLDDVDLRSRIAGQKDKEYKLTKSENGWTLGLDDQAGNDISKPILLDKEELLKDTDTSSKINDQEAEDEEDEEFEWEDVDLKPPNKPKDNFDYSLKAGRLPEIEATKQIVGSQSFLDTRPNFESPLKKTNINSPLKHVINVEAPFVKNEPVVSIIKRNSDTLDEEDEDGYMDQLHEIEMMEAMQKSKLEQFEKQKKLQEEERKKQVERKKEQEEIEKKLLQKGSLPQPKNIGQSLETASTKDAEKSTAGAQDLTFILKKLPAMNTSSLLFGSQESTIGVSGLENNNKNEDKEEEGGKENKKVPETPSWFNSGPQDMTDVYNQSRFVDDKKVDESKDGEDKGYQLLSGFLNTEELIKENNENKKLGNNVEEISGSDDSFVEITNVKDDDHKFENITEHSSSEQVEVKESKESQSVDSSSPEVDAFSHILEGNIDAEKEKEENGSLRRVANSSNKPMVFNYEFLPEEEEDMVDDIRQEAKEFETFKNQELLNGYNPPESHHDKVIDNAFMEDELFDQQTKDKRDADEVTLEMVSDVQELLSRFGIPFVTAPMEAEAQCAELLQLNLVDGVITDDSDVFLFGGTKIYKNIFQDKKYVEFYDYNAIEQKLGLNRENMIELALLLGSDYTTGIKSMGPVSSMEVIAEFKNLKNFKKWYEEGQFDKEKLKNEDKFQKDLRKKLVRNEVILDSDFPNEMVIDAYENPEVDHDKTPFQWSVPDLDMLRQFLQRRVGWSWEKTDEVLIPLIRDINKRKQQGHSRQMTLNDFFPSDFAANVNNTRTKINMGKRITNASNKLKKQKLK
ncbi:DNA repair protein Rad2p [Monosporozyma unispora]